MKFLKALLILLIVATPSIAKKKGGMWKEARKVGYSTTMQGIPLSEPRDGSGGAVLIAVNYFTEIDSVTAGDSIYTGSTGVYYSKDSAQADTNYLAVDGFIGQTVLVNFFFYGLAAETLFVTVEQGLSFRPQASPADSLPKTGNKWNYGFQALDTLFSDSLHSSLAYFKVSALSGDSAVTWRQWTDHFTITAPIIRLKIKNKGATSLLRQTYAELYIRNKDEVLGGASGRLNDRWSPKK